MLRGLRVFRSAWWPYKGRLTAGAMLVVLMALFQVAAPWPLKVIIDDVVKQKTVHHSSEAILAFLPDGIRTDTGRLFLVALTAMVTLTVLSAIADYLSEICLEGVGERVTADLRRQVYQHLQRLSLGFHDQQRTGDLVTKATADVGYVESMIIAVLSVVLPSVTVITMIVVVCLLINPLFAVVALGVTPLLFGLTVHYRSRIKRAAATSRRRESDIAADITETFAAVRVMQAYGAEDHHLDRFDQRNTARLAAGLRSVSLKATLGPLVDVVTALGTVLVLLIGVDQVRSGQLTIGLLVVFLAYLKAVYDPMRSLAKLTTVVSRGRASLERLRDLLDEEPQIVSRNGAVAPTRAHGAIELESVAFAYPGRDAVLHEVSLRIDPGEVVAIVGPTGAGKSTIAALLPRLYDVTSGRVLLDGTDVRDYDLGWLRSQIALVQQDAVMFNGTIYDNIAYGSPHATREQVLSAATAAYVDEFVDQLPAGYDTQVAERGISLSGGQRQRIGIARALVRDAPIVVLDEPTSGLDAIAERYVLRGLEQLMVGRTVIVIAHRLSTIRRADRICVLDGGRVVEQGSHDDLVGAGGLYGRMDQVLRDGGAALSSPAQRDSTRAVAQ